jgi:PAS domain S-box-containing protein
MQKTNEKHVLSPNVSPPVADRASDADFPRAGDRWEAEERLRIALDASSTGIFHWDIRADMVRWDENLNRLFGLTEAASPRTVAQFLLVVHPADRARVEQACRRCATVGATFNEEMRTVWPDGTTHWLSGKGRSYRDADGVLSYLTGAATDVTERVEHEHAEREMRAAAERAIRARDEVLAVVAHDLRNPVHTIMMSASAMLELALDEESRTQQLAIILRAASGMNHLIRDLLVAARIDSGSFEMKQSPVPVGPLLDEMMELFELQARDRHITIGCALDGELPLMSADRDRIVQVISNIVGNALKFTPRDGAIALRARLSGEMVEIAVADTGMGIPAEHLPHIFDRFWQADRRKMAGAGLGLAIAKGIVEAHGGRIWVESEVGRGTTFHFTIPAVTA